MRGLRPEEALERWSDPRAHAAMLEYLDARTPVSVANGANPTPAVLRYREYRRRRDPLDNQIGEYLRDARLVATALYRRPGEPAERIILNPELFLRAAIDFEMEIIRGEVGGMRLEHVELLEPPIVPLNVDVVPDWYRRLFPEPGLEDNHVAPVDPPAFQADADYREVVLNGERYLLTDLQGKIVRQLHEAWLAGQPWCYGLKLLHQAGSRTSRIYQVFKRLETWTHLIESDGRGHYRLKIDR